MKIHTVVQGTPEWFEVRLGKFTASDAQAIANNGKGLDTLICEKLAETLTGKMKEEYTNVDIERGRELEEMARNSYEIETGKKVEQVGFIEVDEFTGCSPDGFVEDDGLVEFKCKNDVNYVRFLLDRKIDPAHLYQMQMQMFVTGRGWCDYVVFNPNFAKPIVVTRVNREEETIEKIKVGLEKGIEQMNALMQKLQ